MRLSYEDLAGAAYACGFVQAGAGADDNMPEAQKVAEERASAALVAFNEARDAVAHGAVCLVLTRAELNELRHAAGNSTSDPDWYKSMAQTPARRRALLSVAGKVGFLVMVPDAAHAQLNRRRKERP